MSSYFKFEIVVPKLNKRSFLCDMIPIFVKIKLNSVMIFICTQVKEM
jgi:hypothetical protein